MLSNWLMKNLSRNKKMRNREEYSEPSSRNVQDMSAIIVWKTHGSLKTVSSFQSFLPCFECKK